MTLIVGLRGADGVVLASDSQGTHDDLRQPTQKLFKTPSGVIWGTAGPLAGTQALYSELESLELKRNPRREDAKTAIGKAIQAAAASLVSGDGGSEWFEGLFAWFDESDGRHYLLLARADGHAEFKAPYGAIGSSRGYGLFGFNRSAFVDYKKLELETTKMLTFTVADDAVRASAKGVDGPIQMAVVSGALSYILSGDELHLVQETAAAFQLHQLDFLKQSPATEGRGPDGIVPGNRGG